MMMWHYYNNYPPGPLAAIFGFLLYFTPSFVAFYRRHHNRMAIAVLNLFLGWSGLGWIVALIWSFTVVQQTPKT
jgi:hypothetical protein